LQSRRTPKGGEINAVPGKGGKIVQKQKRSQRWPPAFIEAVAKKEVTIEGENLQGEFSRRKIHRRRRKRGELTGKKNIKVEEWRNGPGEKKRKGKDRPRRKEKEGRLEPKKGESASREGGGKRFAN